MANDPLSIVLAGCGNAGMNHGLAIAACPELRLLAVCDVDQGTAESAAAQLGGCGAYTDFGSMLDAERPDAVAVVTPDHVHVPQILAAAQRGLHVLTEKPLGITVGECEEAVAACRDAGVLLAVTYTYHFIHDFRIMREVVDRGEIGQVREVRWLRFGGPPESPQAEPPEPLSEHHREAQVTHLFDCGVHAFDLMCWFAGAPMVEVTAHATAAGPGWEPSSVTIVFSYAGGQRGVYENGSMTALPGSDRGQPSLSFLVSGTRGSITWDFKTGWCEQRDRTRICVHTPEGTRAEYIPTYGKCRDIQHAEFAQAIRTGALPSHWPTPEQAVEATRMGVEAVAAVERNTRYLTDFLDTR